MIIYRTVKYYLYHDFKIRWPISKQNIAHTNRQKYLLFSSSYVKNYEKKIEKYFVAEKTIAILSFSCLKITLKIFEKFVNLKT